MAYNLKLSKFEQDGGEKLGTFLGVFTPAILTILGVILFMRTGWVVGNAGLAGALAIIVIAHIITLSTTFSVSAIATNMRVGAGGAYFMISRSLGLEFGGAVGIPLYLAQTLSVTLYAFGLAESLTLVWPEIPVRAASAVIIVAVSLIAGRGAAWALKLQLPIMGAIAVAVLSFLAGAFGGDAVEATHAAAELAKADFWLVFAVFFPAVTGLMAGVSLSGDLENPQKSIPLGTMAAVLVGFVIYIIVAIAISGAADTRTLMEDHLIWFTVGAVPLLIFPGLWGAIFSSAVGSMLGAPRTLEALAGDRVAPRFFHSPKDREGTLGYTPAHIFSTVIALAALGLGALDTVAPVLTMFFLAAYGMINLVAGIEKVTCSPSYRPTIDIPWWVSIGGFTACLAVMLLIAPLWCVVAVGVEIAIFIWLRGRSLKAPWGDLRHGALISLIRALFISIRKLPLSPRNWRPHILLFAGSIEKRMELVMVADWLNQRRGVLTVCRLEVGELDQWIDRRKELIEEMDEILDEEQIIAFPTVSISSDFEQGVLQMAQDHGIGGLEPNTLMFGWSDKPGRNEAVLRLMGTTARMGLSAVLCRLSEQPWDTNEEKGRIDVWWGGLQKNGDMLLLFAHLVASDMDWEDAEIRVLSAASNPMMREQTAANLKKMLSTSRIKATVEIIEMHHGKNMAELINKHSADAALVFMGLNIPEPGEEEKYVERLHELTEGLNAVVFVRSAGPFAGSLLQ